MTSPCWCPTLGITSVRLEEGTDVYLVNTNPVTWHDAWTDEVVDPALVLESDAFVASVVDNAD